MEAWSAGVTVVPGETWFTDAGPSPGVRPAGVIHGAGCTALTVCTERTGLLAVISRLNKVISLLIRRTGV